MSRFTGPKPSEIRGGLGIDRSISSEIVPTASQVGAYSQADRQNVGYSGTPMWKIMQERAAKEQEMMANRPALKIPEGFMPVEKATAVHLPKAGRWYFSEKSQTFWNASDGLMYVWDAASGKHVELHQAHTYKHRIAVGTCIHEDASQVRKVEVTDMAKAAQALRMSIEHIDRPCSFYALFEGHNANPGATGAGNVCADYCAKNFHQKLLVKLANFRGFWMDEQLQAAIRDTFQELDAEFIEKHPGVPDGCCAAAMLVIGDRLVIANLGDVACVVCTKNGEAAELMQPHAIKDPNEDDDDDDDDEDVPATSSRQAPSGPAPPIRWTRSFGDQQFKHPETVAMSGVPLLGNVPDVKVVQMQHRHQGVALICRALYNAIGRSMAVSTVFKRSAGRPRMASGALVDAAVQWLGRVGDLGLGSVVLSLDKVDAPDAPPPAKTAKTQTPSQVRLRHILLKHRECKSTVDKVRNKQVKRSRGEAERQLRAILEECEGDPDRGAFAKRCKELSECQSCLKAGDLAGDLGWIKPGKLGPQFDAAAFALQVKQVSDLVDSEQGIHILLRSA